MKFALDPRLEQDSDFITDLPLCQARLSKNGAFPWIILIPKIANASEIIDLNLDDQAQLLTEIRQTSHILQRHFKPKKLNIANLGNMVAQLHVHVIARFDTDPAWPNPVWNSGFNTPYTPSDKDKLLTQLVNLFQE